ncbi:hypothetical protein Patl1_07497 [Pistacia atlantica]|uniref:Uncharacterized protein n=1 Tax=Pistacia atlantica TaxID=434234 RepID=A0ACC1AJU8_9ROSI|nr:hypothetical protein Patl1_07497 [Pistacia atlantica]
MLTATLKDLLFFPDDPEKKKSGEELLSYTDTFNRDVYPSFKGDPVKQAGPAFDYWENALNKFDDGPFFLGVQANIHDCYFVYKICSIFAIVTIADEDGDYLVEAWEHILTCVSRFEHNVQVCWEKFARYFEVELKEVKLRDGYYVMDPQKAVEMVDENTICVAAILGSTLNGEFEDVKLLNDLLTEKNKQTGRDTPIHVDAEAVGLLLHSFTRSLSGISRCLWYRALM